MTVLTPGSFSPCHRRLPLHCAQYIKSDILCVRCTSENSNEWTILWVCRVPALLTASWFAYSILFNLPDGFLFCSLRISLVQIVLTFVLVGVVLIIRIILVLRSTQGTYCHHSQKYDIAANHTTVLFGDCQAAWYCVEMSFCYVVECKYCVSLTSMLKDSMIDITPRCTLFWPKAIIFFSTWSMGNTSVH